MTAMTITNISTYTNWGHACEQSLAYALTGEIRAHDSVPFDKDSDIPEFHMSVKSRKFTLASSRVLPGDTWEEMIDNFFQMTASKVFAYVTKEMVAYMMDADEFREFLTLFSFLDRESTAHGGGYKVRAKEESKKMLAWLMANA